MSAAGIGGRPPATAESGGGANNGDGQGATAAAPPDVSGVTAGAGPAASGDVTAVARLTIAAAGTAAATQTSLLPPPAPEPPPLAASGSGGGGITLRGGARPARPIPPPDPALLEAGRGGGAGPLPRVGPDGRTAIRAYANTGFDRADPRPRVAVVLAGIGLSASSTEEAIRRLPSAISLVLNPYAARLDQVAERARERGMETLIALPMEPTGYPLDDPGPQALLTGQPLVENLNRLDWALSRSAGYVGVLGGLGTMRGERFAQMGELLGMVQDVLRARGLLYVDPRPGAPAPARAWGRSVDLVLDEPATRGEIERRLAELERLARERGSALGLAGDAAPVLVERLAAWAAGLDARGVALVPVTALIRPPEGLPSPGGPEEGPEPARPRLNAEAERAPLPPPHPGSRSRD